LLLFFIHCSFASNSVLLEPNIRLSWMITEQNTIVANIETSYRSWVGLGWHCASCNDTGMTNADFIITQFDDQGNPLVFDFVSAKQEQGYDIPDEDTARDCENNVLRFSGVQGDEYTSVTWERKLVTNDSCDWPITNGDMLVIWAHGGDQSNTLTYHGPNNRGSTIINFFTGMQKNVGNYTQRMILLHGSLMVFSFVICMSFGIFVARFLKDYHWWFPLHILVQVIGVLGSISGLIVAIVMTKNHFSNVHSWFGISVLGLGILSPAIGLASHLVFNPQRESIPIWPDQIHWWIGRLTVVGSYVTIFLGLRQYGVPSDLQGIFWVFPAFYFVVLTFVEVYRYISSKESGEKYQNLK